MVTKSIFVLFNSKNEFAVGTNHINGIENFWAVQSSFIKISWASQA